MGVRKRGSKREPDYLYQRNGVFYARLTVNGIEQRESLKTRDRAEAERRLGPWLESRSLYHGTVRHTFREAAALWFDAGDWKPKTLTGYAKLLSVLDGYLGELYWDQVDKARLQWLATELRKPKGPYQRTAGTATINRYLSVISGIADHVRELPGWPELNPVSLMPRKPRREKRQSYVRPPIEDIEAYFARMRGTFGDLCRMALLTGARMDELATLKAADARNGKMQLWQTKHQFRVVPLCQEAQAIVARQKANADGWLFATAAGTPYRRVTEMWREIVLRAQKMAQAEGRTLTRMRFHDLRHEYAIRYLESGGSIYELQKLLGHSTVSQTEWYLRYLTPSQAAEAKR
ncbi:tyrosine-type recombinase/integrase [Sphingomonas baiyangensis]|uniref:Site-specific integrase n=1 Tax=Sphingomonas baiyangensis TaxID=2572576 RepID=A0A4U1L1V1_9SPHN|nr:site-specific integrase [Sphingomonas baiyangensis]TKD50180.1 site-specific integrase [Sphingomonas baiyangensis]